MISGIRRLLSLFISVNILAMCQPVWAISCKAALGGSDVPKFSDNKYVDYEITFNDISPNEGVMISMHLNGDGIQILNREAWKKYTLDSNRANLEQLKSESPMNSNMKK